MQCDFIDLANDGVQGLSPYQPGKPIEELERELGLKDVVKLASNENPLGVSPLALKAYQQVGNKLHLYPDASGYELKRCLAESLEVEPEQITLGNGSNDILDLLARVFLDADSAGLYSQHGFVVYPIAIQAQGAQAIVVPARDWGHDLEAMAAAITDKTRLVFIANPNNPTGTWLKKAELEAFLKKVPETVVVVLDEAYFEYVGEGEYPDGVTLLQDFANLVVTRTFSKAYGLAGLRIGYSISHPQIADLLNRIRAPFNVNLPALAAAQAAYNDVDFLRRSLKTNQAGLKQLAAGFAELGLDFIPSVGNFIAVEMPVGNDPAGAMSYYNALLKKGVITRPVGVYQMPNHLRISVGLEQENQRCLQALKEVLAELGSGGSA
ncbi:histidinol-phosphate transaminase [Spongiibacter sp. KMU-158]|uniref:Histidinol-phosphate aminotransferase n=1 Tax=Spongiibacter pelagi TaxID=2760804 RepID=A0A927C269_9GAMM|nr:histidinol-phosphate transaminase [Spongiibacter pelagi]MBD2859919.1 histidinol-phosphate transaminase [Spongiibacter pelagi]